MEPIKIPLKLKYRTLGSVKQQKSSSGTSGKNKRNKASASEKRNLKPQPIVALHIDGLTGRRSWSKKPA